MSHRSGVGTTLRRLAASANGNLTILFSLGLCVMVGSAGAAIDYVRMSREETMMSAAADAAALAAVAAATDALTQGRSGAQQIGEAAALKAWKANITAATIGEAKDPLVSLGRQGGGWSATVSFDVAAPTSFMSVLGVKTMRVAGSASASNVLEATGDHWDFHIVADTSSSMALAATPADMLAMQNKYGCEFACHSTMMGFSGKTSGTPAAVKVAGIKLRIDSVDDAIDGLISEIVCWHGAKLVRTALWGLNNTVESLVALTGTLEDVEAHDLQIAKEMSSIGNTNFEVALAKLANDLPASGGGGSAAAPREAVFLITDGLNDSRIPTATFVSQWNGPHYIGTVDPAGCEALKSKGITVGVLYIDYYTAKGYESVTAPVIDDILPRLKACASDNLFFNATDPAGMADAMKEMFDLTVNSTPAGRLRLTN